MKKLTGIMLGMLFTASAWAADVPKIAVPDLAVTREVQHYLHEKNFDDSDSYNEDGVGHSKTTSHEKTELKSQKEHFEIRNFSGGIKSGLIRQTNFRLTQAKPFTNKEDEGLYDIIQRIKDGYFPGADYVLFGIVNSIEMDYQNQEISPQHQSYYATVTASVEFSLINTKTFEVKAGMSVTGSGQDTKIIKAGTNVRPSMAKAFSEASKDLGNDLAKQLSEQFAAEDEISEEPVSTPVKDTKVITIPAADAASAPK